MKCCYKAIDARIELISDTDIRNVIIHDFHIHLRITHFIQI